MSEDFKSLNPAFNRSMKRVEAPELLADPCPCCGSSATIEFGGEVGRWDTYDIECDHCGLRINGPTGAEGDAAKALAVTAWNRRAPSPEIAGAPKSDWFAGDVDADGNELVTVRKDEIAGLVSALERIDAELWKISGKPVKRNMDAYVSAAQNIEEITRTALATWSKP